MMQAEESIYAELDRLGGIFAAAKANRVYLGEFRKSKKAILMKAAAVADPKLAVTGQEREAYAHPEYLELLEGIQAATHKEALTAHKIEMIKMQFESWKEKQYTARAEMKLR